MNRVVKRMVAVLFCLMMLGVLPERYALAEAPEEMQQAEQMTEEEIIEEDEIPLAAGTRDGYKVFLWGGMAMVIVLTLITGYSSFEAVNMKKTK